MSRERVLQRRLHTLNTLEEAISAMRSLSAHHFRLSRQLLPTARCYRDEIERAVVEAGVDQLPDTTAPTGFLLIVSDLGLCGDYNVRLVKAALEQQQQRGDSPLFCVGRRPRAILARHKIQPRKTYAAPTSVDGLSSLLLNLAEDMLDEFAERRIGSLAVISARFEGAGHFKPVVTPVLPIQPRRVGNPLRSTTYQTFRHLAAVAAREYLYTTLYELLLDSLASEHGMRLIAAESARSWLEDTGRSVKQSLAAGRREIATQEVLDIVAGCQTPGQSD